MQRTTDYTVVPENNPRRRKLSGGKKKNVSVVPSHFIQTDVSRVKGETSIFSNLIFYFVNVPTLHSLDSLHKMVVENGSTFSMNLNSSVTHCIASESKGFKFQAAKHEGDVVHYTWLLECCAQKQLLPLQPKQFLKYRNWEVPSELAIRRMKIEICIGGGSIAETLSHATHLVIVSSPEYCLDFDTLLNSFSEAERRLLNRKSLQVVKSQWLDDCFEKKQKLPEDKYNLKPQQFQETSRGERQVFS